MRYGRPVRRPVAQLSAPDKEETRALQEELDKVKEQLAASNRELESCLSSRSEAFELVKQADTRIEVLSNMLEQSAHTNIQLAQKHIDQAYARAFPVDLLEEIKNRRPRTKTGLGTSLDADSVVKAGRPATPGARDIHGRERRRVSWEAGTPGLHPAHAGPRHKEKRTPTQMVEARRARARLHRTGGGADSVV